MYSIYGFLVSFINVFFFQSVETGILVIRLSAVRKDVKNDGRSFTLFNILKPRNWKKPSTLAQTDLTTCRTYIYMTDVLTKFIFNLLHRAIPW